ncbi:MAG TPA: hypothetical protein VMF03_18140 [Steroidobacteraceae bacterium]|nr:hypothetical protein [Steroidobacteraceae bacterium]
MHHRSLPVAVLSLAVLFSVAAWGQVTSGGDTVNPNRVLPSEAATVRTPGTPGATDTPGALQEGKKDAPAVHNPTPREIRAMKKQARKASSSAPASK